MEEKWFDIRWFDFHYTEKGYLFLLVLIIPLFWLHWRNTMSKPSTIKHSDVGQFSFPGYNWQLVPHFYFLIRCCAFALLVFALARPQGNAKDIVKKQNGEGIDIVFALDVSTSMLAQDFKPNRLEAAKELGIDFISERSNDRIGLVIYGGEALTQCPLTTDHSVLKRLFSQVNTGFVEDGTAIGLGLATAVNRLRESDAKSKVIILLTDGINNSGNIDPMTAADIAAEYGIRVYAIGVGKNGTAPYPMSNPLGQEMLVDVEVKIDEALMMDIANATGGKYFRAENNSGLKKVYKEIDKLEKSLVKVIELKSDPPEKFHSFVAIALALLAFEFLCKRFFFSGLNEA
jgi:Ca-activated chloride channel family protein